MQIARFCHRIIEAGWLVAVLVVPLHFDPYVVRTFDVDKTALLRSIGLMMLLAWVIAWIERREQRTSSWLALPVLRSLPLGFQTALLFLVVYLLATATSVIPRASFWGAYIRLQGFYTTAAYFIVFGLISLTLNSSAQVDRLIDTILLTSLPVVFMAILQQTGLSPVGWQAEDPTRAFSTVGNPIFLGAYLIMVIPMTALRAFQAAVQLRSSPHPRRLYAAVVTMLLFGQVGTLALTGSRGPWLAFAGTIPLLALLWIATGRRKRLLLTMLSALMIVGAILLVLYLRLPSWDSLANHPITRWLGTTRVARVDTIRSRILIWEGVIDLIRSDTGRMVLGYGPETIQEVLMPHVPPELSHYEAADRLPDRAHNLVFDVLMTTGAAGLVAYLAFFGSLLYIGLRSLGLITGHTAKAGLAGTLILSSLLGAIVPWLIFRTWTYSGPGLAIGQIVGVALYLVVATFRVQPATSRAENPNLPAVSDRSLVLIALLAALMAHFLEVNLGGIPTTLTQLYFWVSAGLLVALTSRPALLTAEPAVAPDLAGQPETINTETPWSSLAGLILITLTFGILPTQPFNPAVHPLSPVWLLGGAWLFSLVYVVARSNPFISGNSWVALVPGVIRHFVAWSLGSLVVFLIYRAIVLIAGGDAISMLFGYWALLVVTWGITAIFLETPVLDRLSRPQLRNGINSRQRIALYVLLGLLSATFIIRTNLVLVEADIYAQAAAAYAGTQQWDASFLLYNRALALAPEEQVYLTRLAKTYVDRALSANPDQRATWFSRAQTVFGQARALNPRHPDHAFNLAHLYLVWAQTTPDRAQQAFLLDQALTAYQTAAEMAPLRPQIFNEWAIAAQLKRDYNLAFDLLRHSLELDPRLSQSYLLLGRLYKTVGRIDEAMQMMEEARRLDPESVEVNLALSEVYLDEDLVENALEASKRAVAIDPENYLSHYYLARVYERLDQIEAALAEAQSAFNYAPPEARPDLILLIQALQTRRP